MLKFLPLYIVEICVATALRVADYFDRLLGQLKLGEERGFQ